jgi:hypothetical protein
MAEELARTFVPGVAASPEYDELDFSSRESDLGCLCHRQAERVVFAPQHEHRVVHPGNVHSEVVVAHGGPCQR